MQIRLRIAIALVALVAFVPAMAQADWFEDFEGYAPGDGLHGVNGWYGWNDDLSFDAIISDFYAYSGTNSVAISGLADIVQMFSGYTTGVWNLVTYMYIPEDFTGQTYFIVLNTYAPNGAQNWSVEVNFTGGMITDFSGANTLPYVTGEWAEIELVIDLDADLQTFFYNGDLLYSASWSEGASGGGAVNIGAIDLFANGASPVYYDMMSLTQGGVAVENRSLSNVKSLFQ